MTRLCQCSAATPCWVCRAAAFAAGWSLACRLVWSLPVTLFGLAVFLVRARPRDWSWRWHGHHGTRGIIEVELDPERWFDGFASTFGHIQGYLPGQNREAMRPHEDGHTLQGDILGIFNAVYFLFAGVLVVWFFAVGVEIDPLLRAGRTRAWEAVKNAAWWNNPLEVNARWLEQRP